MRLFAISTGVVLAAAALAACGGDGNGGSDGGRVTPDDVQSCLEGRGFAVTATDPPQGADQITDELTVGDSGPNEVARVQFFNSEESATRTVETLGGGQGGLFEIEQKGSVVALTGPATGDAKDAPKATQLAACF